jgi:predicted nuclease of predicted toxin-antitoxin system
LRFLADESCDFAVVRGLRSSGHDVRALAEETSRTDDRDVIALAAQENRVLLTEDKDFGWLAYVSGAEHHGVILLRYPGRARDAMVRDVQAVVAEQGDELAASFTVLGPGQARVRRP